MLNLSLALDAYQHARQVRLAHGKRRLSTQPPQPEVFAMKKSLVFHWGRRLHIGHHPTDGTFGEINTGHRLIDLKCSRLSCLRIKFLVQLVYGSRPGTCALYEMVATFAAEIGAGIPDFGAPAVRGSLARVGFSRTAAGRGVKWEAA